MLSEVEWSTERHTVKHMAAAGPDAVAQWKEEFLRRSGVIYLLDEEGEKLEETISWDDAFKVGGTFLFEFILHGHEGQAEEEAEED